MGAYIYKRGFFTLFAAGCLVLLLIFAHTGDTHAGDPVNIPGGWNIDKMECLELEEDDGSPKETPEEVDIDEEREEIKEKSQGDNNADIAELEAVCDDMTRKHIFRPIQKTKIEGYVFEFHPVDPSNPAESEWIAAPSHSVPVFATGIGFQIFWVSEPDGFFYFYKTRFGEGPIVLNLKLPEDAHPINPNILIESTGEDEVWTVFLGFYRGDVPPPHVDQLKTPNGNFLPFANTRFEGLVGIDSALILPGVGGELPQETSPIVIVAAALMLIALLGAGFYRLRHKRAAPWPSNLQSR
jgi:hypothetical protein